MPNPSDTSTDHNEGSHRRPESRRRPSRRAVISVLLSRSNNKRVNSRVVFEVFPTPLPPLTKGRIRAMFSTQLGVLGRSTIPQRALEFVGQERRRRTSELRTPLRLQVTCARPEQRGELATVGPPHRQIQFVGGGFLSRNHGVAMCLESKAG